MVVREMGQFVDRTIPGADGGGLIFGIFILSRGLHPMLIQASKDDHTQRIMYSINSPAMLSQLICVALANLIAFEQEGSKGVAKCWNSLGLRIFGMIGLLYGFGDWLEMVSMGFMNGVAYQTLMASKLLITAVLMTTIKGTSLTSLQWHVLLAAALAVNAFVMTDAGDSYDMQGIPVIIVAIVLAKITTSCCAAAMADAKLKAYLVLPMFAKISHMSAVRFLVLVFLSDVGHASVEQDSSRSQHKAGEAFLHNWNSTTWLVMLSFLVKSLITLQLLKRLDAIQKNVGEIISCLMVYWWHVSNKDHVFDMCTFVLSVLVIILIRLYGLVSGLPRPYPKVKVDDMPVVLGGHCGESLTDDGMWKGRDVLPTVQKSCVSQDCSFGTPRSDRLPDLY